MSNSACMVWWGRQCYRREVLIAPIWILDWKDGLTSCVILRNLNVQGFCSIFFFMMFLSFSVLVNSLSRWMTSELIALVVDFWLYFWFGLLCNASDGSEKLNPQRKCYGGKTKKQLLTLFFLLWHDLQGYSDDTLWWNPKCSLSVYLRNYIWIPYSFTK